ncbi:hypothetical protein D1007_59566 [Hordeum vulgare]|nr:hypothetical protein D1007_59566 [Hordeum vulgare]
MHDDLDAAAGLASLASSGITTAPSDKGKPRAPCKTAATPKKKKQLTPEERARESAKRKGRRHVADARDEVAHVVRQLLPLARQSVSKPLPFPSTFPKTIPPTRALGYSPCTTT